MISDQGSRGLAERLAQKSEWTADEFKKWIREVGEEIKKMECGIAGIRKGNKE